eukprot:5144602-Prymnesium_polylepis.2
MAVMDEQLRKDRSAAVGVMCASHARSRGQAPCVKPRHQAGRVTLTVSVTHDTWPWGHACQQLLSASCHLRSRHHVRHVYV